MADTDRDLSAPGSQCVCQQIDVYNLRRYVNSENKLIGTFCTKCKTENLTKEYVVRVKDDEDTKEYGEMQEMISRPLPNLSEIKAFQVRSSKTKVDLTHFADILKPGDQISWHRRYFFWHHAIVSEVIAETSELMLIHWNKEDGRIKIIRSRYNVDPNENKLFNKMYRIDYSEEITKANDQELVLARARSRIGDTGYFPFTDDCETFATYCKTGVEKSHQLAWLKGKCKEIVGQNIILAAKSITKGTCLIVQHTVSVAKQIIPSVIQDTSMAAGKIFSAEGIEHAMKGSNFVGAGIVIVLEAGFVTWDLNQAYKERKKGNTSRNDFIETAIRRLVEGVLSAGLSILCSLGPELIGIAVGSPLGPVGIIIGGIVGGIIGGVVGKMAGTALGSVLGKAISSTFKADDRAVTSIADLKYGDHIVGYGWVLHPRCHAIVVDHNGVDKIKVIRNSYKRGVVEECIPFSKPLFKVEYQQGTCKDPEKVVEMARSKLGENQYSLAIYNCKTFARQCKSSLHVEPEEEPWQLIEYDDIPDEALQQPCGTGNISPQ
ncbi:uncharacterized protein LOC110458160 isoform X2 [Mizuhopecten yessoensis]|nr:uncharacterized protein LOC110458160 isoform X2 [Mizuhopecten yessoensis]XP_021365436.1 uncharacterized protein LOC110458160 isoform X2 [Mizuhopecten yessoensis]XP_021365438.1 uncharacterized protein LOC110458160 isoform X2 [Mizuhopecten yessoensis]XP_021365439.1 uncharacterized protein LOC110458160 isoform X2 [Mizuhopecten yessoensis]